MRIITMPGRLNVNKWRIGMSDACQIGRWPMPPRTLASRVEKWRFAIRRATTMGKSYSVNEMGGADCSVRDKQVKIEDAS